MKKPFAPLVPDIAPAELIAQLALANALDLNHLRGRGQWSSVRVWNQSQALNLASPPADVIDMPIMFETHVHYEGPMTPPRTEHVLFLPQLAARVVARPLQGSQGNMETHMLRLVTDEEVHSCIRTCPLFRVEIIKGLNALFKAFGTMKN